MTKLYYMTLVLITTALMGSSFAIGKIGLSYVSPLLLVAFRFTIAGLIMGVAVALLKLPHPKSIQAWLRVLLIGSLQTAGVMGCIFLSLRTITAGETSILTFTNPLLVVVFGTLFTGARYSVMQWMGVLIGMVGVMITVGLHMQLKTGTLLGFGAAVSWAVATLLIKKWGHQFNIWVLTAYQMLFGGAILLLCSALLERPTLTLTAMSVTIIMWLAIMASIVQFAIWFYLINKGDPGKTSSFLFLAPFFGVLSGWLLLDEPITWPVLIGGLLIFIGIFLVNRQPQPRLKQPPKPTFKTTTKTSSMTTTKQTITNMKPVQ